MKQKEMNDEWLKEKHWINEVLQNQQNLSNEELTILMIVKNCYNDNKKNLKDLIHNNYISIDSIFIHLFFYLFFLFVFSIYWFQSKRNEMKQYEIK